VSVTQPLPRPELVGGTRRRRGSLATRIIVTTTAVAVLAGLLTAVIAGGLLRANSEQKARNTLKRVADAAQAVSGGSAGTAGQLQTRAFLMKLTVPYAVINGSGRVTGRPVARLAVTPTDVSHVLAGQSVSAVRHVAGRAVYIEARPTPTGGIVVAQRRADAPGFGATEQRRLLVALLIGVAVAALAGALVAGVLARPLRRTAAAARALAAGHREVAVQPGGPAEIADVSTAVNQLSQSLTYSEARQRDFLLSVSHDLRTPLTSIRGYAESVADGVATGAQAQYAAGVILAEAQRLERLVADLLDLARLGAVDFRVDIGPVELGGFVDGVAAGWQPRCAAAGVAFQAYRPTGPLVVPTDGMRLRQAVDGLLENALRIVPAGAPIVVEAHPDGFGGGVVEVRDGGPGLSDADLAVAFEQGALFNRYRGVREVGTGLGLAIVAGIVARLGAYIDAGHAPEGGARFTISLRPGQGSPVGGG
jgi:two-component system OmpR family sensor kinase